MFRFLAFLFGVVAGFIAAVFVLPIPGKTFFNRLSKLPNEVKTLIDDVLDLSNAVLSLGLTTVEGLESKLRKSLKAAKEIINSEKK